MLSDGSMSVSQTQKRGHIVLTPMTPIDFEGKG